MLFNSLDFAIFLPVVFILYWFVFNGNLRRQNMLVVAASYYFYGSWDYRFLGLIVFSTVVDFVIGNRLRTIERARGRQLLLGLSLAVNLGLLGYFKYWNFFLDSFVEAFRFFGSEISADRLEIILPVGISFYTFQTLSYTIDVYRKRLEPAGSLIDFAAFVSFFPQLVAGPIERASNLLPQFYRKRNFEYAKAVDGMRQILWGLFKKVVIADGCAEYVNLIFDGSSDYPGSVLLIGAVLFAFQIYGDFSGYSDIAIGTSRLFGFNLMRNFAYPYFSRDIAEFWRRWHISLSTWFRDYLYIPLGGSRGGTWMKVRNTFIIFLVSGFWHGANWTFIVWGGLNALLFLPLLLRKRNRSNLEIVAADRLLPTLPDFLRMVATFSLVTLAWVFFRAESIEHAVNYLSGIFSPSLFELPGRSMLKGVAKLVVLISFFQALEWIGRREEFAIARFGLSWWRPLRWAFYFTLILSVLYCSSDQQSFIYFQF
ncbi:MBOAT family protein [Neolewinella aurantiaca]|uniref:MBOAT family protein n=1 Tax=Neolewinella aurantiaca TaxID=2602767 RepID=A0A5C7G030_9BACT|nr:MBOAT family O-acyltransferase [Neolewinella aurantiaca]TXF90966.1 MBOAT family protein [Neolewinella aurantiaca]